MQRLGRINATVPDLAGAATAGALAELVLRDAPVRFVLAGFSLGGFVALEMVARAPNRVSRLALIATTARPVPQAQAAARQADWEAARHEAVDAVVARDLWPIYVAASRREDRALRETVLAMARDIGRAAWERQVQAALTRPDSRHGLTRVAVPTLVMTGSEDKLCPPEHAREMGAAIPGARTVLLPGVGHFLPLEAPDALAAEMAALLAQAPR